MISTTLRYFLQVANLGSVTMAAEVLHVAPSAISRRIQSLEQRHKTVLFERNARGMRLTESGEVLAAYVRRAMLEAERIGTELSDLSALGKSVIRIAANEGFGREFIPHVIGEFLKVERNVSCDLQVAKRNDIVKKVRQGDIDIGMTYSMAAIEGVNVGYSRRSPLYAIMSPAHPLAQHGILSLRQIAGYEVVMSSTESSTRALVEHCCMHAQVQLNYVFVSDYSGALMHFVRDFEAITLAGTLTVRYAVLRGEVVAIPLTDSDLYDRTVQIYTMQGRHLPRSVASFLDLMIRMAAEP